MATESELSHDVIENDLAIAEEETDLDAFNNETFGDGATFDEDWEYQHEKLAQMLTKQEQETIDRKNREAYEIGISHVISNEHQIDSSGDFFGKLPSENTFSSPPLALIDSIWNNDPSSHKCPETNNTNIALTATPNIRTCQALENDDSIPARTIIKRPMKAEDLEAMLLSTDNNRKTLASVENSNLIGEENGVQNDQNSGWSPFSMDGFISNIKPTSRNQFEEDENIQPRRISQLKPTMFGETSPSNPSNGKPPVKPMTLEELERVLIGEEDKKDNREQDRSQQAENNLNKLFPGGKLHGDSLESKPAQKPQPTSPIAMIPVPGPLINPNPMFRPPFISNIGASPLLPPNVAHLGAFNPLMPATRFNFNRMMVPRLIGPPPIPNPAYIRHHQMQQLQQYQQRFPHQRRQYYHHRGGGRQYNNERNPSGDEYAGLMTQSNKEWIIKIQSHQLNFDDPYKEDYYFVSYNSRKLTAAAKAKEGEDGKSIPALIIPERKNDKTTTREYVPAQFEGSLGKIQVANVNCPRRLLDLDSKQTTEIVKPDNERPMTPIGRAELNAFRRLLMEIEKLYVVMLDIDEEDKKMGALPEEAQKPHRDKRDELCLQLFRGVYDEKAKNINLRIANVRKGAALVVRSLQVLASPEQKALIVRGLLEDNNAHLILHQRDKSPYRIDFKEILMNTIKDLQDSKLPNIDKLANRLNDLTISSNKTTATQSKQSVHK